MIPILILAAGQSSRMRGKDKLLMDVGGQPLLARQIEMASGVGHVFAAISPDQTTRMEVAESSGASVLTTHDASEGIGGTLRNVVPLLPSVGTFMVLLSDLICIEAKDLLELVEASHEHVDHLIWRGATADGAAGHPIIFVDQLRPFFSSLRGDRGANAIVAQHANQTYLHRFSDNRARYDLDTPEDWDAWRLAQK